MTFDFFNLKYAPIASYGCNYAAALSNSAYSITDCFRASCACLLLQYRDKHRTRFGICREYSSCNPDNHRWFGRGLGTFFIRRMDRKDAATDDAKRHFEDHTKALVEQLEKDRAKTEEELKHVDFLNLVQFSRYNKELLQHLYTGERKIFDLLNRFTDADVGSSNMQYEIRPELKKIIKGIIDKQHHSPENTGDEALRFISEMADYMLERIGTEREQSLDFKVQSKEIFHYITKPELQYSLNYIKKEDADSVANEMNGIELGSQLSEKVREYHRLVKEKELRANCEKLLESIFKAVNTKGKILGGGCEGCLDLYHPDDANTLKQKFAELEKTTVYGVWFKK